MSANFKNINRLPSRQNQESWLTKDRFWNFVFWFGMSGGFSFATFVKFTLGLPEFVPYILILNIIIFPILIMYFNKTNVFKKRIVNSENIKLKKKQLPSRHFIWSTALAIAITISLTDKYAGRQTLSCFLLFVGLMSGFCMYFIVKNCPITILFNRKMWNIELHPIDPQDNDHFVHANSHNPNRFMRNSHNNSDRFNVTTNPAYSSLSSNIYNKYR